MHAFLAGSLVGPFSNPGSLYTTDVNIGFYFPITLGICIFYFLLVPQNSRISYSNRK